MPFVSITRLRLRKWYFVPLFLVPALRSARQAQKAEGNLAVTLLREKRRTFWTRTVWTDERAMRAFMTSGAHGKTMRRLMVWADEAHVLNWTQESDEPPPWTVAHERLLKEGRPSKLKFPTEDHKARRFPAPQVTSTGETVLK
jgi:heme-degrading monooxygenase HmoA